MDGMKKLLAAAAAVTMAVFFIGTAWAQQAPGPGGGFGRMGGRLTGNWNPQQMQQRMLDRIKTELQVTDREWQVLEPRIEKVMRLARQTRGRRMMMRRRGGEGETGRMPAGQTSAVDRAAGELRGVLADKNAAPRDISLKLAAFRRARKTALRELQEAQNNLIEVLTPRQEAQLVLMGILD